MKRILYLFLCLVMVIGTVSACAPAPAATEQQPPAESSAATTAPVAEATTAPAAEAPAAEAPAAEATTAPAGDEVAEEDKYGGTLVLTEGAIKQFDPAFCSDDPSFHAISQIFSMLFRVIEGKVIPDLATSWDYEDDGKIVILHLRKGVMFHDDNAVFAKGQSREVVADDVVYSIKRMFELEGTQTFPDFTAAYESVEAIDPYTVKLTLKAPDALLFYNARGLANVGIVPHEAIEKLGEDFAQNPIGSGPFKFSEYQADDHLTLVRNDLYWKKPYLEKLVYKIIPDESVAIMSLESGEVDITGLPTNDFQRLSQDPAYNTIPVKSCPGATQLMFNVKAAPYDDQEFRHALSYAIDGQGIGKNILKDMYVPGCGTAGPGVPGYDADLCKHFVYDPEKAKELLDQLGYKEGSDGMRLDKDGQPLKLELEIWSFSPMPEYGAALVSQLKEVGLNVELQTVEFGTFIDDWNSGPDKMMTMSGWCGDGGTNGLWGRTGWAPELNYDDDEVFDLLDLSNEIVDAAKRDETIRQASDMMYSRYWAIPMGFEYFYQITNARVHDFRSFIWFQNIVTEENNVWIEKE